MNISTLNLLLAVLLVAFVAAVGMFVDIWWLLRELKHLQGRLPGELPLEISCPESPTIPNTMYNIRLTTDQKARVRVTPFTRGGIKATLDGKPNWAVLSGNASLEVAEDGLSAVIIAPKIPDLSQIQISGDADLSDNRRLLSNTILLTTVAAEAANLAIDVDEITDKDAVEPPSPTDNPNGTAPTTEAQPEVITKAE